MFAKIQSWFESLFALANGPTRRPLLRKNLESNIDGLFIIGDLAGAPVIKLAMEHGHDVIEHIASLGTEASRDEDILDVLIVGAGASGLNAALAAQSKGMRSLVLEKEKIANTIENFPEGKWVYAEPDTKPPKGKLWLDGARKEDLIQRWNSIIAENGLDVRTEEAVSSISRSEGVFDVRTVKANYRARYVVLATGQRGNPRKLNVPGEDQEHVYHRLYSPRKYQDEDILIVGGGNSAVEAAITLSEHNRVVLSYRRSEFGRVFKDNERQLNERVAAGAISLLFNSNVKEFARDSVRLKVKDENGETEQTLPMDHAFVLAGAELPIPFLKSLGIKLENEWEGSLWRSVAFAVVSLIGLWFAGGATGVVPDALLTSSAWIGGFAALTSVGSLIAFGLRGDRWAWLGLSFLIWYAIYGIKVGQGAEFWPFEGWGYEALSLADRPWSFWYTVLYTGLMTIFGIQALKRWGLERQDRFQIWRFASLVGFQWVFFFIVPEFLFQWAVEFQWLGAELSGDPQFAEQSWRSYGIVYAWPLFFYTFFYDPHQVWIVWGVLLTFVVIPGIVLFFGKRYCSWVCGCGGLAETFGDRWRHLAPKGKTSIAWEKMGTAVLILACLITIAMLTRDILGVFSGTAELSLRLYGLIVDVWLVGILPVTLYPFLGGKVWCRYWCPLAKLMQFVSGWYAKFKVSRFHIVANDKCIACNECSRNCQVGIDVMAYALKQEVLDNRTSSCIGCGICVTVCPMDVLSFETKPDPATDNRKGPQFVPIQDMTIDGNKKIKG